MPEMTVQAEVSFEVWCDTCGAGLCRTVSVKGNYIYVPPCEKCMEGERVNGRDEGYADGYEVGYKEGLDDSEV